MRLIIYLVWFVLSVGASDPIENDNKLVSRRDLSGQYHPELHGDHSHSHSHAHANVDRIVGLQAPVVDSILSTPGLPPYGGYEFPPPPPPPPPPHTTPNGYANCGCVPLGHCPQYIRDIQRTLLLELKNDVVCGLTAYELCCQPYDPWPGQIDQFKPLAVCLPVEQCTRKYGDSPTDVANYGSIGPCLGLGSVRCLDDKPLPGGPTTVVIPIIDQPPTVYVPPQPAVPPGVYEPPPPPPVVYVPPAPAPPPPVVYVPPPPVAEPPTVYEPPVVYTPPTPAPPPPVVYEPPPVVYQPPPVVYEPPPPVTIPPVIYKPPTPVLPPPVVYEPPPVVYEPPPVVYEPPPPVTIPPVIYKPPTPVLPPPVVYEPPPVVYEPPPVAYEPPTTYEAPTPITTYEAPVPITTYEAPTPVTTYEAPVPVTTYEAPTPVTTYEAPVATYEPPIPSTDYGTPIIEDVVPARESYIHRRFPNYYRGYSRFPYRGYFNSYGYPYGGFGFRKRIHFSKGYGGIF